MAYGYNNRGKDDLVIEHRFSYQSWGEFVQYAEKRVRCNASIQAGREASRKVSMPSWDGTTWSGTQTFEEALNLALNGWPEGSSKASELSEALFEKVSSLVEVTDLQYDYEGTDFDMGLYMKGEPECWYRFTNHMAEREGTRQLRLMFNSTTSAGVSTKIMEAKGAAIGALIQTLEFAGYRIEVWLQSANNEFLWECMLKAADQPLDIDRLMYALAHPSCFRRLIFSHYEGCEEFMQKYAFGYGYPTETPKSMRGDIYIGSSFYGEPQWTNAESAQAWIIAEIQKQGIKVTSPSK